MADKGEEMVFPFQLSSFLGEAVHKVHSFSSFMARGPHHNDLDIKVSREDRVNVGLEEDGGFLGRMGGRIEDRFQGRRGVAEELDFVDRGTVVDFPAGKVGGVGEGVRVGLVRAKYDRAERA